MEPAIAPRDSARGWAALAVAGGAAWVLTLVQARSMGAGPGTMGMPFLFFVVVWVGMMAAMMLPAIGPAAAEGSVRLAESLAFGVGFLAPWAVYGAAAFGIFSAADRLVESSPGVARWTGVAIVAVAGVFQLTPLKMRALDRCRHAGEEPRGLAVRLRAGMRDGVGCVGCCWALMATLVAVGAMNVAAMAGLAVIIFAEKILPKPRLAATLAGLALLAFAVVAIAEPSVLHGLVRSAGSVHMQMPMMNGM